MAGADGKRHKRDAAQADLLTPTHDHSPARAGPARAGLAHNSARGAMGEASAFAHTGHRERLRNRFHLGGADAMPDYELLELLLFRCIPRRDTKELAKRLLARFGTFAEVINAPAERLLEVKGVGDAVVSDFKVVRAVAQRMMRSELMERPSLSSIQDVIAYVQAAQGFESREIFRVIFLDKKNRLIADEVQGAGTVDHTPVYVREVLKRALDLGATAMILVHNHPTWPCLITMDHAQAA